MPSIHVDSGIEEGACYGFPPGDAIFVVGRAPNCHIVLTDALVSRQHSRIERLGASYKVTDLSSHNGTYVNGEKLPLDGSRELRFGDSVRLGETELVLQEAAPDDEGELAGRRLGSYQLVRKIGSGGMGEVYKAIQIALGRPVAVKILSPELTRDGAFVTRFMTEARAAGKLNHPNVVQVHEVAEVEGVYYYSMEFLAGGSVQELIRGGKKLPVEQCVKIVLGAARALEYAEKQGIIHCDVKPDNLMLTDDGEVRLADLGIARTVASRGAKVKQEGGVLGSPHYMAPEQARGEPIDRRVDIYSLGATFYRLVSGRTPFSGKDAREIMEKQVYEDPPALRTLDATIPQSACRIIGKMMKKSPEKRYQSAGALVVELARLQEELVEVRAGSQISQMRRFLGLKRRPSHRGLRLGAALLAVILLGVAAWLVHARLGAAGPQSKALEAMLAEVETRAERGDLEAALEICRQVLNRASPDSPLHARAARREERLKSEMEARRSSANAEAEWRRLAAVAAEPGEPRALARAYGEFVKNFPGSPRLAAAREAARQWRQRYQADAEAALQAAAARAPALVAECRFAELRQAWEQVIAGFPETPAAERAAERAAAARDLPDKQLAAAAAEADAALAAGRFEAVAAPFARLQKTDLPELASRAAQLDRDYAAKVAEARAKQAREEALRRVAAACQALADQALALARACDYSGAQVRFSEAALACRQAGLEAEAAALNVVARDCRREQALLERLIAFANEGKLAMARVKLADGREADLVGLDGAGLTYTRGMARNYTLPWKDVPVGSVFALLRRLKLSTDDRVTLAGFAVRRGLAAEAREEVEKVLAAEPNRKAELAPLLEAIEKVEARKPGDAVKP